VLCCAVLCCAVLCCAVLCCAVLCCAVLCCAVLCCAVLCCAVLCCAVLCCVTWHLRYNAQAHVNRGVVLLEAGSLEEARQAFSDAAAIQPLCVQALYNLG